MALFKLRKKKVDEPATPAQAESVEVMRRRARHRLIGAVVLVLIGVIGFPLLFDTQPRPVAVDIPIEIPDRNKVKPLPMRRRQGAQRGRRWRRPLRRFGARGGRLRAKPGGQSRSPKPEPRAEAPKPESPRPEARGKRRKPKPGSRRAAGRRRQGAGAAGRQAGAGRGARSRGRRGRFVVQVGAFADATKAREARLKLEKAGLKTYTNVAETKDGKRIRVRVGPFATKAEADKAAEKIKELDLPAAVLTL
jgi:DedD protein